MHELWSSVKLPFVRTGRRLWFLFGGVLGATLAVGQPAQANLVINVTYPNPDNVPAAAMTEINGVVTLLQNSFVNNATVNITVDFTSACGLGCSSTLGFTGITCANWRTAMNNASALFPQDTFLAAAIGTLPVADPIGNGTMSFVRTADAEAIGLANFAGTDSNLTFNNGANTFEFTGVPTAGRFDFQNVFEHELDEALGIGSALTDIANNGALPTSFEPEDFFRYSSTPNVRSITTSPTANVFFSYNGTTDVQMFNQNNTACGNTTADRDDWINEPNSGCTAPATPHVQDAVGFPGQVAVYGPGSPEFIALETLGWKSCGASRGSRARHARAARHLSPWPGRATPSAPIVEFLWGLRRHGGRRSCEALGKTGVSCYSGEASPIDDSPMAVRIATGGSVDLCDLTLEVSRCLIFAALPACSLGPGAPGRGGEGPRPDWRRWLRCVDVCYIGVYCSNLEI